MPNIINQHPKYEVLPVGQQVIFTVSNLGIITSHYNVKFVAEVHVSTTPINLSVSDTLVGTFKTTPNNAGRGIFDFRNLLESYVSADNMGSASGQGSSYKTVAYGGGTEHPIHIIDKFARMTNAFRYFAVQFKIVGSSTPNGVITNISGQAQNSLEYKIFNGVLQYNNILNFDGVNYGFDMTDAGLFQLDSNSSFLSNAPATQYARLTDYGTFAMFNTVPDSADKITGIEFKFYDSNNSLLDDFVASQHTSTGGSTNYSTNLATQLLYRGVFPANLDNWSITWDTHKANVSYYTVQLKNSGGNATKLYTIKIIDDCRFEGIRLTWLNQWGAWDYYTFNKKSVKSVNTSRTSYTQMSGTWNDSLFRIDSYKGGKKNFRVNSKEKIKVNTDFVTEEEAVWFEELINSPEVYILNGYQDDSSATITNRYVEPVLLTTSSYVRKTKANDRLIQYTFEMERNKTQQTQTV